MYELHLPTHTIDDEDDALLTLYDRTEDAADLDDKPWLDAELADL